MRKNDSWDSAPQKIQAEKVGWIRKFCRRGIFRDIWKNRFVVLRGDQLLICEKEVNPRGRDLQVNDLGLVDEVLDLLDYDHCEEIRKNQSRSKKNHSKFRLQRCSGTGNPVQNLVFLAVSPEDKDSWITVLNAAINRAKNRILDEVTADSPLSHLTRDRVKIPHSRRLPTRGHLLAVASTSSSDETLTLDLIQEKDVPPPLCSPSPDCPSSKIDGALSVRFASGKHQSLPQEAEVQVENQRCVSMEEITVSRSPTSSLAGTATPIIQLQQLIGQKLERTEQLLMEVQGDAETSEGTHGKTERLFWEATAAWNQANQVLEEVMELRELYQQLHSSKSPIPNTNWQPDHKSPK